MNPPHWLRLYRLLYESKTCIPDNLSSRREALQDILICARRRNIKCGVSGILVHNQDEFFQVLEGGQTAVDWIFSSILHDRRHRDIVVLQRGPVESRIFHSWSMAYKELPRGSFWFDHPVHAMPGVMLASLDNSVPGCLAAGTR